MTNAAVTNVILDSKRIGTRRNATATTTAIVVLPNEQKIKIEGLYGQIFDINVKGWSIYLNNTKIFQEKYPIEHESIIWVKVDENGNLRFPFKCTLKDTIFGTHGTGYQTIDSINKTLNHNMNLKISIIG